MAGPVVAAAVILPEGVCVDGADDSKQLSPRVREELYVQIFEVAECVGVGAASVREIDRRNILRATTVAMQRALDKLPVTPGHIVVDGLPVKYLGREHEAVGDGGSEIRNPDAHRHATRQKRIESQTERGSGSLTDGAGPIIWDNSD